MRSALIFFGFILCYCQSVGQGKVSDSLKLLIQSAKGEKLSDLNLDLGQQVYFESGQYDSLIFYAKRALKISERQRNKKQQLFALKFISIGYSLGAKYHVSNDYLDKALALAKEINEQSSVADIYNKFGYNYQLMNQPEKAIDAYIVGATVFEKRKDWDELAAAYQNISSVFSSLKREKECIEYLSKMLQLIPKLEVKRSQVSSYSAASNLYADFSVKNNNFEDSVLKYTRIGIPIAQKEKLYNELGELYCARAKIYEQQGKYSECIVACFKALEFHDNQGEGVLFNAYNNLQISFRKSDNLQKSGLYLDSMLTLEITKSYIPYQVIYFESKYEFSKAIGDFKSALGALESLKIVEDSLLNAERTGVISELEQKYNRVRNLSKIKELKQIQALSDQENKIQALQITQLIFGVALLIVLVILVAYFYWNSNENKKRKINDIEQRLNRARMDPHFVFNVLAALQYLELEEDRKHLLGGYISRFSKLMRLSLESTYTELTTLENELDFLVSYLELQKLLKKDSFTYAIQIDPAVDPFEIKIPGMIIQPFIENSIEHGLSGKKSGGEVFINFKQVKNELHIQIVDNGTEQETKHVKNSFPSRATQIIQDRLSLLGTAYKKNASFETKVNPTGGYHVSIILPLIY